MADSTMNLSLYASLSPRYPSYTDLIPPSLSIFIHNDGHFNESPHTLFIFLVHV